VGSFDIGLVPWRQVKTVCATCLVYGYYTCARVPAVDTLVWVGVLF